MSPWLYLIQQTACAFSLLVALGLSLGLRPGNPWRLLLVSLGCGSSALLLHPLILPFLIMLAPIAAWPGLSRRQVPFMMLSCLMLTLLMAGCSRMLFRLGLTRTPLILAQCLLLPLTIRFLPRASAPRCITLQVVHQGRKLRLSALVDSGNLLRDPITALPVIVISRPAAARLTPLPSDSLPPGMRLISVRTVAGSALMPIFRPQQASLLLPTGWRTVDALIGLSPEGYSGFHALVPGSLINLQGGTSYVHDL